MNITQHERVMNALEMRAMRYRNRGKQLDDDTLLYHNALDETGTVSTADLTDSDTESVSSLEVSQQINITEQLEVQKIRGVSDEVLQVHGVAPGKKPDGVKRLLMENPNGLNTIITNNEKLEKAKAIIDELEADIVAFSEHRINCRHKANKNGLVQMFNGGESDIRAVVGHNVHENVSRTQEGGVSLLLYGDLIEQYDYEHSGKDETGLGRWVSMVFQGEDEIVTRVVCCYNPCYNNKKGSRTTYQQHRRYFIRQEKDTTCPRKRFRQDLQKQLQSWREQGERLIVCMDANEHIYNKSIGKMLTDRDDLNMREVVGDFTGQKLGATFFRGSTPIDGIWATPDIEVTGACVMPCGYGIGDHRMFIVDFRTSSLIGAQPPRVLRSAARRLNTAIPYTAVKYDEDLEGNFAHHRIVERTILAHQSSANKTIVQERLDRIDVEAKQYMAHAEKKCRRIKSGRIPFSPDSAIWIRRGQVYRSLLRYHAKKIHNRGNLKRAARRCGIDNPLRLSIEEIHTRLKLCKEKCKYFRRHGQRYRRKHLNNRLQAAKDRGDEEAEVKILAILTREKNRSYWRRLNYSMAKPRGRSVRTVQTVDATSGITTEHNTEAAVQEAIWNEIHGQRFYLAEQAPVCQGRLRGDFGYMAVSPTAKAVLAGTYNYPPDFDQATQELMEECARIRLKVPKDSVNIDVTCPQWQHHWGKANERTSSSESGLHFGHYKAGASSEHISTFHALKTTLALRRGIALARWSRGLSVMLEKMFGCSLVTKLRAILLMEADFNATNKMIFGNRMMNNVRRHGYMPEEIYSEKGKMADDGSLAKVLFYDIARQSRVASAVASVDAANCYDSIAHAIASMVFQAFGVPTSAIESMLTAIQNMKYFLRTAYGDSKDFAGSTLEVKFQGLCQGNGAAPAGWAVISITIIGAHKRKGHGGFFVCPISKMSGDLAAILFVDDTDLIHIRMDKQETSSEVHAALQQSIYNWGQLLIASGGAFKPEKCFFHIMSFDWKADGRWCYANNETEEEFGIEVPMPDGSSVPIAHLSVDTSKETLGVWTCPSGSAAQSLAVLQEKAQKWIDRAKEAKMMRRDIWFLLDHQLWPKLDYGLCSNTASFADLAGCLKKQWWQLIPLGGIRRTARNEIRQLSRGFYGAGCQHPGVECGAGQVNKLLMHFGCPSSLGLEMNVSLELLILELGITAQPLQESYKKYGGWATHSWLKSLWEKCDLLDFRVEFREGIIKLPRERDRWIMLEFMRLGYSLKDLARLNRVRQYQQVLFLSCVLGASGKDLDDRYLNKRAPTAKWSRLKFTQQRPPRKDFRLWEQALRQLVPAGGIQDRLGAWLHDGYKIWDWRFDQNANRLLHYQDDEVHIYEPSQQPRYANRANRWEKQATTVHNVHQPREGRICSVKSRTPTVFSIASTADYQPRPTRFGDILDVLMAWGQTWLWDNLVVTGDDNWILDAIRHGTLVCVTDGSYLKELYPDICSAAFILECTQGRGRIFGYFTEQSSAACAYRGELLGLLAIHLLLLAANTIRPRLTGEAHVYSDCLGALERVAHLPANRIPSRCKHSDILKTIMINCQQLTFDLAYSHVEAHQDDTTAFHRLSFPSQLNCRMDAAAKQAIIDLVDVELPQEVLPLESVAVFVGKEKMTSSTGGVLRFWAYRRLAKQAFHSLNILFADQFEEVDWPSVFDGLHNVPRMFEIWACKQVMDEAPTNFALHKYKPDHDPKCPSCGDCNETCAHVLHCEEAGRVESLQRSIHLLDQWLIDHQTDRGLRQIIIEYASGRGSKSLFDITGSMDVRYSRLAASQDVIGWRRFMEGMISKEMIKIQEQFYEIQGGRLRPKVWASTLVIKLLEVTHGQWLYRNVHVHDSMTGIHATTRKEQLQKEIEDQIELGGDGLAEEDKWLLEINLEDLESTSGETQEYWLLAILAARESRRLRAQTTTTTTVGTNE